MRPRYTDLGNFINRWQNLVFEENIVIWRDFPEPDLGGVCYLEAGFLPNFSNNPYASEIFMFLNSIRFNNGIVCRGSD